MYGPNIAKPSAANPITDDSTLASESSKLLIVFINKVCGLFLRAPKLLIGDI